MKRSISEVEPDSGIEANKKAKLANPAEDESGNISFESVPQDVLNTILDLFEDVRDIKSLGLACSRLQNRSRSFWESTASTLVPIRAQPYKLHQKQFISQKVIDLKKKHNGVVPFKLLDFSNIDPTRSATDKKGANDEDDDESGQFNPTDMRFLPWDSTRFVLLTCNQLSVFSIHQPKPIYQQQFKATAFNKLALCSKTHSIAALVRLDRGAGAEIYVLNDDAGYISLVHTIRLEKKSPKKKAKKKTIKPVSGRGKPAARPIHEDEDLEESDEQDSGDGEERDEENEGDGENEEDNENDDEGDEQDDEGGEEDDYDVPKFRQTCYQNLALGDKYVAVSQRVNIKQFSVATGKLVKTETFSESEVTERLHAANPEEARYLEFYTLVLSLDGAKAYAWSTQHYFDGGPLYELEIATGTYRIAFRPHGADFDKYPDIEFLNDGEYLQIESLGSNSSSWFVHRNEPPYRQLGSFSEDFCGGNLILSPDVSKCLFYSYGSTIKVHTFPDPDQPINAENPDNATEFELGEDADWTFKWHPKNSSIFFASTGDKVKIFKLNEPDGVMTLDQPFSNSFWFLQDMSHYEQVIGANGQTKSSHVLLLFVDSDLHAIVWDLPFAL